MIDFSHSTVMKVEAVNALQPVSGGVYVDGTLGGAGHSERILETCSPLGRLVGFDRDAAALEAARQRLGRFGDRVRLVHSNFDEISGHLEPASCSGVLLDLGVSSPQLDRADRGFSFQSDGPLDMRMDVRDGPTAAELVNTLGAEEMARMFFELGEETRSRPIARAIVERREARAFQTTLELAELIERVNPRHGSRIHPATKVFQALRLAVNDELGSLRRGLDGAFAVLKSGGRLAVISFHSLEDRIVKEFGRTKARDYNVTGEVDRPEFRVSRTPELRCVTRKPMTPGEEELRENPRSRSAKLRVFEKI